MESSRVTGAMLIAGVLSMILGVAAHPHHGPVGSSADQVWRNLVVAAIVVGSYGMLGVGFLRLLRSMSPRLWKDFAGVALAFAGICGALAAIAGHVVVPRVLQHMSRSDVLQSPAEPIAVNEMIFSATLAQTSLVAWAIGALFLSADMFRLSWGWKILGACGVVLGLCLLAALAQGQLEITLHSVGLVTLASGIWIGAIGIGVCGYQASAGRLPATSIES